MASYGGNVESYEVTLTKSYFWGHRFFRPFFNLDPQPTRGILVKKLVLADASVLLKCTSTKIAVWKW